MLTTLIPFFDKDMKVCAYSLFSQKENYLLNPALQGSAMNDGAATVSGLEIIEKIGIDTLTPGTDVFVPVGPISIYSDIEGEVDSLGGRIVLLIDNKIQNTESYRKRMEQLKEKGYKLAVRKVPVSAFEQSKEIFSLMDYIILDCKKVDVTKAKIYFGKLYPNIKICVGNIESQEQFDTFKKDDSYVLFEVLSYSDYQGRDRDSAIKGKLSGVDEYCQRQRL